MKIKDLFKIEFLKSINLYTFIVLVYTVINFLVFFRDGNYVKNIESIPGVGINYMPFIFFYILFSAIIVLSATRDINNKIIVKHFADGMSRNDYFFGKILLLLAGNFIFIFLSSLLLFFIAIYYSVSFETYLSNVFNISHFTMLFMSLTYFGLLGYLYAFIIKNSLLSVLLIIGQLILEFSLFLIGQMYKIEVFNYLPFALYRDLINKSSTNDFYSVLFLFIYIIILLFFIRKKINQVK
jgi:hypothetical protein